MVVQGSPTKIVHKTETKTEIKSKETFEACSQDSDTDFTVETEELEALEESSSDSENDDKNEVLEENFTIEVQNGFAQKLKFPPLKAPFLQDIETKETDIHEKASFEDLKKPLNDEDDENDPDYNPCHDTLSDVESDEDEGLTESDPEIEEENGTNKRTGHPHQRIKMKCQMDVPPIDFENEAQFPQETEISEQLANAKIQK